MKNTLKAEMWDRLQYFFKHFFDRTMHCVTYYDGQLDQDILQKVYYNFAINAPILRSTFKYNPIRPYWKVNDIKYSDFFKLIITDKVNLDKEINSFLLSIIYPTDKTQFKIRLFRCNGKDVLVCLFNHMCFDGGDLKYVQEKVSEAYTQLSLGKEYKFDIKNGTRSASQVYSSMSKEDKKAAKSLYKNVTNIDKIYFPFTDKSDSDKPRIIKHLIDADTFLAMKSKSKSMGYTLNDIIIAAYARALMNVCDLPLDRCFTIPNMIDIRRYIEGGKTSGLTNMTSIIQCKLEGGVGNDIFDTVKNANSAMNKLKQDKFMGLYGLPLINLAYTIFPQFISDIALKIGYKTPLCALSNIGIIDDAKIKMSEIQAEYSYLTGGIKFKPFFQLALTTYKNVITLSLAIKCSDQDEIKIKEFYKFFIEEINHFINN